jgi:hypothetical protein
MATMVRITEVNIISIDKSEDSWAIEGEITFEEDLSTEFAVTYLADEDEFEDLKLAINPGHYDKQQLKEMIIDAALEYDI